MAGLSGERKADFLHKYAREAVNKYHHHKHKQEKKWTAQLEMWEIFYRIADEILGLYDGKIRATRLQQGYYMVFQSFFNP